MNKELELLRIFRAAADCTSFRDAAARLGTSPQGVTRAIKELERHYDEILFHRSTRQIRITYFGIELLDQIRPILDQFEDLWRRPENNQSVEISGKVRITAPHSLGYRAVFPVIEQIANKYPSIDLDLRLSDRISNTVEEGIDVGIRVGSLRDSRFVARKAANMRLPIVAAPSLISKVGEPEDVTMLETLPVIGSLDINTGRPWPWLLKNGRQWVPSKPILTSDDADIDLSAALAGIAFAQLADYMAAPHIANGNLVQVLKHEEPAAWGLFVYRPQRGPVPSRIRVVFDELHNSLKSLPTLSR